MLGNFDYEHAQGCVARARKFDAGFPKTFHNCVAVDASPGPAAAAQQIAACAQVEVRDKLVFEQRRDGFRDRRWASLAQRLAEAGWREAHVGGLVGSENHDRLTSSRRSIAVPRSGSASTSSMGQASSMESRRIRPHSGTVPAWRWRMVMFVEDRFWTAQTTKVRSAGLLMGPSLPGRCPLGHEEDSYLGIR